MSDEGKSTVALPINKNRGDIQSWTNYCQIKHMSHAMKLRERETEQILKRKINIFENQFGFM